MKRHMVSGKIEEVIYAQLARGEDLLRALWDICKQNNVKTGILLDATGALDQVRVHKLSPGAIYGIDFAEIPGPLEVSAHGVIGMGWIPDKSVPPPPGISRSSYDTGFGGAGFEGHETPYFHVHITATSASQTICGHLLEGSHVGRDDKGELHARSHFTVAIAKVSGVILRATWDKSGFYHDVVRA
ncbi:putative DNA-binding protein with PD1-like motif [Bradyrhizobium sp. USDA 4518]